jgi:hypothetical protein
MYASSEWLPATVSVPREGAHFLPGISRVLGCSGRGYPNFAHSPQSTLLALLAPYRLAHLEKYHSFCGRLSTMGRTAACWWRYAGGHGG